jgi:hypothetical protein
MFGYGARRQSSRTNHTRRDPMEQYGLNYSHVEAFLQDFDITDEVGLFMHPRLSH